MRIGSLLQFSAVLCDKQFALRRLWFAVCGLLFAVRGLRFAYCASQQPPGHDPSARSGPNGYRTPNRAANRTTVVSDNPITAK
jgi:hypothetical protein